MDIQILGKQYKHNRHQEQGLKTNLAPHSFSLEIQPLFNIICKQIQQSDEREIQLEKQKYGTISVSDLNETNKCLFPCRQVACRFISLWYEMSRLNYLPQLSISYTPLNQEVVLIQCTYECLTVFIQTYITKHTMTSV